MNPNGTSIYRIEQDDWLDKFHQLVEKGILKNVPMINI